MIKLPLSFGRWSKNVLDFSEANIKNSCIAESALIFLVKFAAEKYLRFRTGLKQSIIGRHLREVSLNRLPYWLTGIFVFSKSFSISLGREMNRLNFILTLWS